MRIRTIKPEFFTHEAIFEAEKQSGLPLRLAFIGLWCCADREGRFKWEPRRLGVNILPYDDVNFSDILDALHGFGFVNRYGDGKYGEIPSFKNHQCINQREAQSQIPPYEDDCEFTHVHARESEYNYTGVNIQPKLRSFVFLRDGHKCVRCGSQENLTVDHIFPQSIGGTHAKQNLRTLCRSCNSSRPVGGIRLIEDLAIDGLTLDDMERICTHVQARGEGKGKEQGKEGKGKGKEVASLTLPFGSEAFASAWSDWQNHRKEIRKPITPTSGKQQMKELESMGEENAIATIRHTIQKGWQGLRPPDNLVKSPVPASDLPLESIQKRIMGLCAGWGLPLAKNESDAIIAQGNIFAALTMDQWEIIKDYLAAKLPEGSPGWQPRTRIKFIQTVSDVWSYAEQWARKNRRYKSDLI